MEDDEGEEILFNIVLADFPMEKENSLVEFQSRLLF